MITHKNVATFRQEIKNSNNNKLKNKEQLGLGVVN